MQMQGMNIEMTKMKFEALKAKYKAQKLEAVATLMIYANNSVGVGEHPQIIDEMDKQVGKIADASERLTLIDNLMQEVVGSESVNG